MQPKNHRNTFVDNSNVHPSTSNGNQQFRPSISVSGNPFSSNSNLIVTQQQQPNRNNNAYNLNVSNANTINHLEAAKRIVAAMQQPQNSSMHLANRPIQSPIQLSQSPNSQAMMDRTQIIRLPEGSQTDAASINNIYQALYLIQQNQLQTAKSKSTQIHTPEVSRPIMATSHNQSILNSSSNSLSAITINSTSQNQNATVLAMSNTNIQLLEAIGRLNSQQNSKQSSHLNVSVIQPDSSVAQHLLNTLQKQCPRTSTGMSSPGFMVINQASKPNVTQLNQTKESVNVLPTSSNSSSNELSNSLILKMPINSKTGIPVWTKLLDKLSNNPENLSEVNRPGKIRDMDDGQRKIQTQPRPQVNNERLSHTGDFNPRTSATNSLKQTTTTSKSSNEIDNHQILRDSKAISYFMTSPNNMTINNDDMINMHFQKSLRDTSDGKKFINQVSTNNFKSIESNTINGNSDNQNFNNKINIKKKSCYSFIDLELPEHGNRNSADNILTRVSTPNKSDSSLTNINNQLTIKEKTDEMVENLLKRSLISNNLTTTKPNNQTSVQVTNPTHSHFSMAVNGNGSTYDYVCKPSIKPQDNNNFTINSRDSHINNTSMVQESSNRVPNFVNCRSNPSKSDLPLKKRIMLDFNENGEINIPDNNFVSTKEECKVEMILPKKEKVPCKRTHSLSTNSENKTDSASTDPVFPITKKRRGRIPGTGKNQKLKEECRLKEMANINQSGTEETWQELIRTIVKPPDIDSISSKTLSAIALDPLKVSKEEFFQIGSCTEVAPKTVKCRSCRQSNTQSGTNNDSSTNAMDDVSSLKSSSKDSSSATVSSFCRFHGFRKLQFNSKGTLTQAGFCKSNEADSQDLSLWRMYHPLPSDMSVPIATYLIDSLSPIFCEIIDAENRFLQQGYGGPEDSEHRSSSVKRNQCYTYYTDHKANASGFVWKRPVVGVREMCDVCETSIFNTHWACRKCGYSICVDCFKERNDTHSSTGIRSSSSSQQDPTENECFQMKSIKNSVHLNTRGASKHRFFSSNHPWAVCTANRQQHNPDQLLKVELIPVKVINELRNRMHTVAKLLQIKLKCSCQTATKYDSPNRSLRDLSHGPNLGADSNNPSGIGNFDLHMLADIALNVVVNTEEKPAGNGRCGEKAGVTGVPRPPPVLSPPHHPENVNHLSYFSQQKSVSEELDSTYSWISVSSNFKMLHLHKAQSVHNLRLFQQRWLHAHPVLVSGCHETMDLSLWTPEKFLAEFESEPAQLVDCETGLSVPRATMKTFWEGFVSVNKRISSSEGSSNPACLKLKDWPPSDDFNDVLPQRCKDILSNLPIKEYTSRHGQLNLAAHLPEFFVRPDLGPKLYNAYGMPRESRLGTTNLHLDIADAVNVMLYVGVPSDYAETETQNSLDSMKEAMVDDCVIRRAEHELPGALWHIFLPKDVPKLRQFLTDVLAERGEPVGPTQDPIHDQLFYLNQSLLNRLKETHDVEGCAIIQFQGDAVFIPAGSPHQVRNLHSCMKVANDFVSPENILNCLLVTKEFRKLSPTHANHEDKLQAKNMIFHSMKDAVSTLIVKNRHLISDVSDRTKNSPIKRKRPSQTDESKQEPWCPSLLKVKEESGLALQSTI